MPSDLFVEVCSIRHIENHPNADRLELATIKGWQCVVQKGKYKEGDLIVYIPIDSLLPEALEAKLFPPESKIRLDKHRIKTIRLRKAVSQGLVVGLDELELDANLKEGTDLKDKLGITKYEPPEPSSGFAQFHGNQVSKKKLNANFQEYTHIQNIKNFPDVFEQCKDQYPTVIISEKCHGTNARFGWVKRTKRPYIPPIKPFTKGKSLRRKALGIYQHLTYLLSLLYSPVVYKLYSLTYVPRIKYGLLDPYEFVFGSHRKQLQDIESLPDAKKDIFYTTDVYLEAVRKYNLKEILKPGEVIYAEIYGWKIQKNYEYGCKENERKIVVFDVQKEIKESYDYKPKEGEMGYVDFEEQRKFCEERGLPMVPVLYIGPWDYNEVKKCTSGHSVLCPEMKKPREGCVVKPTKEIRSYMGRLILKSINDDYLFEDNTEWR